MRDISTLVPDPSQLKALSHPERLKMLGLLRLEGPATATQLAARLGLNSGATSYHLRQLAQYGFIETENGRGNRRERWWRARHETTTFDPSEAHGEALDAGLAVLQSIVANHAQQMQVAHDRFASLPPEWRKAQSFNDMTIPLTAEEAQTLTARLLEVLWEAKRKAPALVAPLPEGLKPFTILLNAFPHPPIGPEDPP